MLERKHQPITEFPKIAHSSSSGSHSLPAVLSPAYKFEPIENDYYFESESESCSGEDESNYESSPDGLKQSNGNSEDGTNDQEGSGDEKPPSIDEKDKSNDCKDDDAQSSRYESFARSGVNLMRNLTQNDESTVSIVAEAAAAATAVVSGRQQQKPSERSSSTGANNKKNDEFTFSLSDIPSMLSRCIGDIGIGEYYDASASAFQPEKDMEKKQYVAASSLWRPYNWHSSQDTVGNKLSARSILFFLCQMNVTNDTSTSMYCLP